MTQTTEHKQFCVAREGCDWQERGFRFQSILN